MSKEIKELAERSPHTIFHELYTEYTHIGCCRGKDMVHWPNEYQQEFWERLNQQLDEGYRKPLLTEESSLGASQKVMEKAEALSRGFPLLPESQGVLSELEELAEEFPDDEVFGFAIRGKISIWKSLLSEKERNDTDSV